MRFVLRVFGLLFASLFAAVIVFTNLPAGKESLVLAYTGWCNTARHGTCLRDIASGVDLYWSTHDRYVESWSADMHRNIYNSPGDYNLYSYHRPDGRTTALNYNQRLQSFAPELSPDQTQYVFASFDGANPVQIRIESIIDGREIGRFPLEIGARFSGQFSWSPDNQHLAYVTTELTQGATTYRPILWLLNTTTGDTIRNETTVSADVAWSPDSQQIAYIPAPGTSVAVVNVTTGETVKHPTAGTYISNPVFSPNGSTLSFINRDPILNQSQVLSLNMQSGKITPLISLLDSETRIEGFDWTAQGMLLIEDRASSSTTDDLYVYHIDPDTGAVTILDHFFAGDFIKVVAW